MRKNLRFLLLVTVARCLFAAVPAAADIKFIDVTKQAGLYEPLRGMMGHGGAWGDVDGDGDLDLYVGGFCDRPSSEYAPADGPVPNRLFLNSGNGTFERANIPAVEFYGRTSGAVFADLDNNGTLELYAANNCKGRTGYESGPQRAAQLRYSNLFRNDGSTLVDISASSGACPKTLGTARNIGVMDFDADGLLDLLVVEDRFTKQPRSVLLRNEGKLRFRDVNKQAGLPGDIFGLGLAVADLNGDMRPDFFVGHSNRMFLSTKGGKYYEPPELTEVFAWEPADNEDWPCGAAFGDLNGDGKLDLVVGIHHERARNRVYINESSRKGQVKFRDVSAEVGLPAELPNKSPHVEIQDFDNDGRPDIYFSTAWLDDDKSVTPLVYRNIGNKNNLPQFEPPRTMKPTDNIVYYPAGPTGDYDNDGRVDVCLINWFSGNYTRLLHNESSPENHWLKVQVVGKTMNRMGIGAQVRVFSGGELLGFQEVTTGYGYASGQEAICHFGLGTAAAVDVEVRLPSGKTIQQQGVAANQRLIIKETQSDEK